MRSRTFSILAALFGASPAVAVTLAHPEIPIFKACAVDMNVNGETVANRILAIGWMETSLTTELQSLGRDHIDLNNFGPSVYLGKTTKENWDASIAELSDTRDIDPYNSGPSDVSETIRAFEDPSGSGFAVLAFEPDGFWSCDILLTAAPVGASQFISNPPSSGDSASTDGITYMSDEHRMSELAEFARLLPFMPTPKHYYSNYLLAEPDTIEKRYGHGIELVFAAEFSTIYPF